MVSGDTYINLNGGTIRIDNADNFTGSSVLIASLGKMKGLGNITTAPKLGWSKTVAVEPGCGYVGQINGYGPYVRFYVNENEESYYGGTTKVKYQYPFVPTNCLVLDESTYSGDWKNYYLNINSGQSSATIKIRNNVPYTTRTFLLENSYDWISVSEYSPNAKEIKITVESYSANYGRYEYIHLKDSNDKYQGIIVSQIG
jgi:hypothetical protein